MLYSWRNLLSKTAKFPGGKCASVLVIIIILCNVVSFKSRVAHKVFTILGSNSLGQLIMLSFQYSELVYTIQVNSTFHAR